MLRREYKMTEEFFAAIPELCGAENAEELGERNREKYQGELRGENDQMENKLQKGRLDPMYEGVPVNDVTDVCQKLGRLCEISHYIQEHGITQLIWEQRELEPELRALEDGGQYKEVFAMMPVDQAILGVWF
jgi:hypothetical protein